jgi:hypothetical protein
MDVLLGIQMGRWLVKKMVVLTAMMMVGKKVELLVDL